MMSPRLTKLPQAARHLPMQMKRTPKQTKRYGAGWSSRSAWAVKTLATATMLVGASMISGCISVSAPDKPIVIELNINIKQEVIYQLAKDAGNTIETNPGIF